MTKYNLAVIGGGAAGLVSSYIAAAVKAKVCLIERDKMGGDCLNTGCVPSKAIIKAAKFVHELKRHEIYGVKDLSYRVDFQGVMNRVHGIIKEIEPHDSIDRYTGLGVECLTGQADIIDSNHIQMGSKTIHTENIILALGAEPFLPPITNLNKIPYLTSENLWDLKELPSQLIVLGGGPIGSELAQSFQRLGSQVTVVEMGDRILAKEDPIVSELMTKHFREEGLNILTGHKALEVIPGDNPKLICQVGDKQVKLPFSHLLVAVGRKPRYENVDWDKLGIKLRPNKTIAVDSYMRANGSNIFAAGDITGPYQFTHMAAHQAYYASVNALFRPIKFQVDYRVVPWVTYTDPEIARVGLNETEAKEQGIDYDLSVYPLSDLDRAITESEAHGSVRVLTQKGKDRILGTTIIGHAAGEINCEYIAAMKHGFGLNKIMGTIHPYPTLSEATKFAAGVWKRSQTKQDSFVFKVLNWIHRYRRT